MSLGSGILRIEAASERGSMSTVIARGLSRLRMGRTFRVFYPTLGDRCSALLLSAFMWVGPLNRTCAIWTFLSSVVCATSCAN